MTKPDDIPQEIWDAAYVALSGTNTGAAIEGLDFVIVQEAMARAIIAATAAEREACLKLASEHAQPGYTDFVDGFNVACVQIAEAIRYRLKGA